MRGKSRRRCGRQLVCNSCATWWKVPFFSAAGGRKQSSRKRVRVFLGAVQKKKSHSQNRAREIARYEGGTAALFFSEKAYE